MEKYDENNMVSVGEIFEYLKLNIKKIIIITIIGTSFGVFYALSLPEIFQSKGSYQIKSNNQSETSGIFSALAGGNISGILSGGSTNLSLPIHILKSKENIIKYLMFKDCKNDLQNCNIDDSKTYPKNFKDYSLTRNDLEKYEKSYNKFQQSLKISSDEGLVIISFSSLSGIDSYNNLNGYMDFINDIEKNKKEEELENSIIFAESQLANGNKNFLKEAYSKALESFTYELSMLNMQKEFLFKIIDSPLIPVKKVSPNKRIIVILFLFGSMSFVLFVIIVRFFISKI